MILYAIKRKIPGSFCYLKDIEANEKYSKSACAPTMGDLHAHSEFKTMWTAEPVLFERLTAVNYLKTALEEFRWGDEHPTEITLVPFLKFEEPVAYLNDAVPCGGGFYVKNELVNTAYKLKEVTNDA